MIRGGGIGDFILTLPALKALRDAHPAADIEILGYKHIAALAENRFYAQAVRSIEYGPLSAFFANNSKLPAEVATYFASFDLIVSYFYDPDQIFETNLHKCGVKNLVCGAGKLKSDEHAARQLARAVENLGIKVVDLAAKVFPSAEDRQFAGDFFRELPQPILAIHPGSGSEKKNWPLENWIELGKDFLARENFRGAMIVISGEADHAQVARLQELWKDERVAFAKDLALTRLAVVLDRTVFIGHDSGISHLAAAAGAKCILLFGPTDPRVWAPLNENVQVIRAPNGDLRRLDVDLLRDALGF